ncbi:MAG: LPS assembly lipoprotein LptE [Elusimicrobiota bacterium]
MNRITAALCLTLAAGLGAGLTGCADEDVRYTPRKQILPAHIKRIAIRPIINKTPQFGLEDKFILRIRDEFLRNGLYQIVPEPEADGLVMVTIMRYILIPTQYDSVLTPTAYKLRLLIDLDFIDRTNNTILFREPNLESIQSYSASTVAGGITEEEARELIWDVLARDIVKRVVEGFGSVTGASQRSVSGESPPDQEQPALPSRPVNPNIY